MTSNATQEAIASPSVNAPAPLPVWVVLDTRTADKGVNSGVSRFVVGLNEMAVYALEHNQTLVCRIDEPVEGDLFDLKGFWQFAAVFLHGGDRDLTHPIGSLSDRVVQRFLGNALSAPSNKVVCVDFGDVWIQDTCFSLQPPPTRSVVLCFPTEDPFELSSDNKFESPVSSAWQGFLNDLAFDELGPFAAKVLGHRQKFV